MADELIPRAFNEFRYECPEDDEEEDYKFLKLIRHAKKLVIKNICGTEAHLRKLEEIGKNQIGQIEYLFFEVDDDESSQDSEDLARQYMEIFRKYFGNI
jgi:hypothetical protein